MLSILHSSFTYIEKIQYNGLCVSWLVMIGYFLLLKPIFYLLFFFSNATQQKHIYQSGFTATLTYLLAALLNVVPSLGCMLGFISNLGWRKNNPGVAYNSIEGTWGQAVTISSIFQPTYFFSWVNFYQYCTVLLLLFWPTFPRGN